MRSMTEGGLAGEYQTRGKAPLRPFGPPPPQGGEERKEFTGRHMLMITLSFFAVIIAVNLLMAWFANATWSGLIVKNGYVASQSFNADQALAKALGWDVKLTREDGALVATFANAAPLLVTGQLRRPATERNDQNLTFTRRERGVYTVDAAPAPGLWDVEIRADEFRKTFRMVVE